MSDDRMTTDDGVRLWHRADGDGPPLVLCHGGPGLWDMLEEPAGRLAGSARVIRWDQRGCGRSDRRGPYTVARFVADLDRLRAHLGYERWVVGGHSWGASLALRYALAFPERTEALVYISGVGLGRAWRAAAREEADRRLTHAQRRRRDELASTDRSPSEEHEYRALCWTPDFAEPSQAFERAMRLARTPFEINWECHAALGAEARTWDEDALVTACRGLDVPSLLLHGAADPRPVWAIDSLFQALPRARREIIADAGHLPWAEAPEQTTAVIAGFLADLTARG